MTLVQLKRDAKEGKIAFEMTRWYEKTGGEIPLHLQGTRKVVRVNSVAIIILNSEGNESELRLGPASLLEYTGECLTLYQEGSRPLTEQEKRVLEHVSEIYKEYADTYSGGFWRVKDYLQNCPCPWMEGNEFIQGKRYDRNTGLVRDKSIKGNPILEYRIHRL